MQTQSVLNPQPVMRKFDGGSTKEAKNNVLLAAISFVVVAAGIGTGWLISGVGGSAGTTNTPVAEGITVSQNEAGVNDESMFTGEAPEGILESGGIEGEGTHHLVREGGPSKYVYLTSSVANLDQFVGKKVKVWGDTIAPKKAGWLMDVGKIKVIE